MQTCKLFKALIMRILLISALIIAVVLTCAASEIPLSLPQCIDLALRNNTSILTGEADKLEAKFQRRLNFTEFLPTVSTWLGYNHSEVGPTSYVYMDPISGIGREQTTESRTSTNFSSGLSLSQTIYDGGYSIANYQKSQFDEKAARYEFENTIQTVIYQVEEAYINFLKAQEIKELKKEAVLRSAEALKRAQSMEKVGASPHSDVLKQQVQYEQDQMNLINAEIQYEETRADLNHVLGLNIGRETEVEDIQFKKTEKISLDEALKTAVNNHPAMKQYEYNLKSARKSIRIAQSGYFPQISGSYSYRWTNESLNKYGDILDKDFNWSASISVGFSIFDGFSRPLNVSKSKIAYKKTQDFMEQTQRAVFLEVKKAHLGLDLTEKQIDLAEAQIKSAEEDLKFSTARYELGSVTVLELIGARVGLNTAKENKITAEYAYMTALARLNKAKGLLK